MAEKPLSSQEEKLLDYIEGELSAAQRQEVEAALAKDPDLAALVRQMRRDRDGLRSLPREEAPDDYADHVMQQRERAMLLGEPAEPVAAEIADGHRAFRLWRAAAYGAMAAAVIVCGSLIAVSLTDTSLLDRATQLATGQGGASDGDRTVAMESPRQMNAPATSSDTRSNEAADVVLDAAADAELGEAKTEGDRLTSLLAEAEAERAETVAAAPASGVGGARGAAGGRDADDAEAAAEPLPSLAAVTAPGADAFFHRARPVSTAAAAREATVEVVADRPNDAARSVVDWALSNNIEVVQAPPVDLRTLTRMGLAREQRPAGAEPDTEAAGNRAMTAAAAPSSAAPVGGRSLEPVVLVMDGRQSDALLPDLVRQLNTGGQIARLRTAMQPPAPLAVAAEPSPVPESLALRRFTAPPVSEQMVWQDGLAWNATAEPEARQDADLAPGVAYGRILELQLPLIEPAPIALADADRPVKVRIEFQPPPAAPARPGAPAPADAPDAPDPSAIPGD